MDTNLKNILNGVVGITLAASLWSCAAENPFDTEGSGTVKLNTVMNNITTRADGDNSSSEEQALRDKCVVYVSRANGNSKDGLIHKWQNLSNVPASLTLKTGNYVAEAWSGDSVTASFDKKFYRAYEPFTITNGATTNVVLNCKIQNVVASINTSTIDPNVLKDDYRIVIKNSRGSLTFDKNNATTERGYFMMPNGDDKLEYEITGTGADGQPFSKRGVVKNNVERAHHYILNFKYGNQDYDDGTGAVFFQITVADENLSSSETVDVPTPPTVNGVEFNINKQQNFINETDIPEEGLMLKVCAFGQGIDEITVESPSASELGIPTVATNIYKMDSNIETQCRNAGLDWTTPTYKSSTNVSTAFLTFSNNMLKRLSAKTTEHVINVTAKDMKGYTTKAELRIARSADAIIIEDPIVVEPIDVNANPMSVTGTTATITFSLSDEYEGIPGVEYSKANEDNWTFVAAGGTNNAPQRISTRAASNTVTITGLETGTRYKYRACCGDFHSETVMYLTTEEKFILPGASFEEWSTYEAQTMLGKKTVILPSNTGDKTTSFWGSGNEGAATANKTLTTQTSDMIHSGSSSAKLASDAAAGVIAAGNLFIGEYVRTDGTNGVLSLGREYNGSHPKKVRVFANYRPASGVKVKSGNEAFVPANFANGLDHGQIYIALTTEPVEIRTNPKDRKLFDADDPVVVAYGQVSWTENFGPDGQLQQVEIPFEYNERAKTKKPTHIVIVCSASKYGDYFSGAAGSTMYIDDFELVY